MNHRDTSSDHSALGQRLHQLAPLLIEVSHDIHSHPEIGGKEHYACDRLIPILKRHGFEIERPVAGLETAFVARKPLGGPGPRVAFLAEYDALPRLGHACGHNWIAATSLGAALALSKVQGVQGGEVLLIGTPGEENVGGKVIMTDTGVFDSVDAAMMVHPSRYTKVDRSSLANCPLEIEFRGRSSHAAAAPQQGINALDATVLLFVAVDQLKRSLRDDARIPGVITQGGDVANVIPDRAVARFSLRAADKVYVDFMRQRVEECARGASIATRCDVSTRLFEPQYVELDSNPVLASLFVKQLEALGIEEDAVEGRGRGSLDIGNVSHKVPAIHPDIAIAGPEAGSHTPAFCEAAISDRADDMIIIAAEALAGVGLKILENPDLAEDARTHIRGLNP